MRGRRPDGPPEAFRLQRRDRATNSFQQPGGSGRPSPRRPSRNSTPSPPPWRRRACRCAWREDSDEPRKPDAVFPNNWVSFHADGTVVLYPMQAENRRVGAAPRRSSTRWRARPGFAVAPHDRPHAPREGGPVPRGHRQPGAGSRARRGLRLPFAAHRRECRARVGARAGIRARAVRRDRCRAARPSTTRTW